MTEKSAQSIPTTMRAVVFEGTDKPLAVNDVPTPKAGPGSVLVKNLVALAEPNAIAMFRGQYGLTYPTPFVPGCRAISRVVETGADTTNFEIGQLVMVEPFLRGRDDPNVQILWGIYGGGSPRPQKLMKDGWRDAVYAQYVRAPLENCWALNESILCGSPKEGNLDYTFAELLALTIQLIPYGGLRSIDLKAGETVIVAPATGVVSGAAVGTAVAMGAAVIAVGRNMESLKKIQATFPNVKIVQLTNKVDEDTAALSKFGPIDAYIDISPGSAAESTHVRSCLMSLRQYGRASLMGSLATNIDIPYAMAMVKNLTIRGQYMYEREHVRGIIKLAESGNLKLGKSAGHEIVGRFKLGEITEALELAARSKQMGKSVVIEME